MPKYYLKPVFWNTKDYKSPSGVKANSGYPKDHGFGHEEWNNSDSMSFKEKNHLFRAFHMEGFGNAPLRTYEGRIFVFMYASHDGVQQLVGVAGNATSLDSDFSREERQKLVNELNIDALSQQAWVTESVRNAHENIKKNFMEYWNRDKLSIPNWKCPANMYFWPSKPITLDASSLMDKKKLLTMFGSYTEIGPRTANHIMVTVPNVLRNENWNNIHNEIEGSFDDPSTEIADVLADRKIGETTKQALIKARIGQGQFRSALVQRWKGACAVTRCNQLQILRASHIKPWERSSNSERLNPANGLLLCANLDALFDKGLISFDDSGAMLIAKSVSAQTRNIIGIPGKLRFDASDEERQFLQYHRRRYFG